MDQYNAGNTQGKQIKLDYRRVQKANTTGQEVSAQYERDSLFFLSRYHAQIQRTLIDASSVDTRLLFFLTIYISQYCLIQLSQAMYGGSDLHINLSDVQDTLNCFPEFVSVST